MPSDDPKPPGWIADIAASYDRLAGQYAAQYFDELDHKPFDREMLTRFARRQPAGARVCDIGCGPGHVARYLAGEGLDVVGVDLSAAMVETAPRLNPGLHFVQSDMLKLPFGDGWFARVAAFYSLIHFERPDMPLSLAELHRVLAPGGVMLLAFHAGEGELHRDEWFGETVAIHVTFYTDEEMIRALEDAGFRVDDSVEREPFEFEYPTRRAYVSAHRPGVNRRGYQFFANPQRSIAACTTVCVILRSPSKYRGPLFVMPANVVEAATVPANADFQSLEEKVLRTIELLRVAREAKATAERAAARLREQLNERDEEVDAMRGELVALRREREEVRTRVEKMLGQIESLTAEESAS